MLNTVSKYSAFTTNAIKEKYTYRFKALMWSMSTLFNMLIQYFLWQSIYKEVDGKFMGIDKESYLLYITFGVVFYNLTSCMENMNIAEDIKSGNISMNLLKPIDYKTMVLFRHIGSKIGEIIGLIPLLIIAVLLVGNVKFNLGVICLFLISMILAFFIVFLFSYIIGMLTFWTTNYWGIQFLTNALTGLFSGQLVAINFYIELGKGSSIFNSTLTFLHTKGFISFFQVLGIMAYCLPFQSMYYTPMSILSGIISGPKSIFFHIMLQIFWIFALSIIVNIMWKAAQKKITILGG